MTVQSKPNPDAQLDNMHEILYLQLGNLPNFIGTHFWNAQNAYTEEEVDPSISWSIREVTSVGLLGDLVGAFLLDV